MKQRIAEADIIINEDPEIFDAVYNAVAALQIIPEQAMRQLTEISRQQSINLLYPEATLALITAIYEQAQSGHVVKIYGEKIIRESIGRRAVANDAYVHFSGNLIEANYQQAVHWYNLMIVNRGIGYFLREQALNEQINEKRRENPQSNILVIGGAAGFLESIFCSKNSLIFFTFRCFHSRIIPK